MLSNTEKGQAQEKNTAKSEQNNINEGSARWASLYKTSPEDTVPKDWEPKPSAPHLNFLFLLESSLCSYSILTFVSGTIGTQGLYLGRVQRVRVGFFQAEW